MAYDPYDSHQNRVARLRRMDDPDLLELAARKIGGHDPVLARELRERAETKRNEKRE